jgi:Protein of unknown function (DUF2764)
MYYDLIASLPQLPHFERAERLPITPLRLEQRLRRLRPKHSDQLNRARPLVRWRAERLTRQTDSSFGAAFSKLMDTQLGASLREYVAFRMTQQTLLAALRRKQDGLGLPEDSNAWGVGPRVHHIRKHWDAPNFGLEHLFPWLPQANEQLSAADAMGLERLLLDLNWRWLTRCAEQSMFGFEAVVAFVFKWDMLRAWLECDPDRAKVRFTELIDKVTHVENT